jgi:serine/threonine protein phosphatase PrpC
MITGWTELNEDAGEDAPPLILLRDEREGFIAVSDGLGGSGSSQHEMGDRIVTGAWLASRAYLGVLEKELPGLLSWEGAEWEEKITWALQETSQALPGKFPGEESRLISKLIRKFPATLSSIAWQKKPDGFLKVQVAQIGDSRAYLLHPVLGLQVLTRDDAVGYPDTLGHLLQGPPMLQCICTDQPWQIHFSSFLLEPDVLLFTASDGCFDYLRHPAELEFLLLDSLMKAEDETIWEASLTGRLKDIASDDVSFVLAAPDGALAALRQRFGARLNQLTREIHDPLIAFTGDLNHGEGSELRNRLWEKYKTGYEAMMPPVPEKKEEKGGYEKGIEIEIETGEDAQGEPQQTGIIEIQSEHGQPPGY